MVLTSSLKFLKTAHAWNNNVNRSSVVTDWGQITRWVPRNDFFTPSAVTFLLDYLVKETVEGGGIDKWNGFRGAPPPSHPSATWLKRKWQFTLYFDMLVELKMNRKLCFSPHFLQSRKFFTRKCTFFSIAKVFVEKFAGKMSFTKVYALNFTTFSSCETFCPRKFLPLK